MPLNGSSLARFAGAVARQGNGVKYTAEEKRQAWGGKIANELCRQKPPDEAMRIIEAWERGEGWAKQEFERMDRQMRNGKQP